ncbi:MAG: glycosyltransferase family 9 protein [Pseudomonadota bacterium]
MDLTGKKGLIIKLRYIGDTLSITPVLENLKKKVSDITVHVLVNKGTEGVLALHPFIDKLWVYDRKIAKKNIVNSIYYHKNIIQQLRSERYDFVIDFSHGDRAAFLSFMTGAPERITYQDSSTLSHIMMNRIIRSDPFKHHIIDYQLESLKFLGLNDFYRSLRIYIPESDHQEVDRLLSDSGISPDSMKFIMHPGARGKLRQWPPERFAEIGRRMKERYGAGVLIVGGPEEADLVEGIEKKMGFPASFKSNELSIIELAALLSRCHLFLGNDSAPGHIAAAVNCPNITLFGPTFPHMWRPLSEVGEVVFKNVPCCGCRQESCIRPERSCMELIGVGEVWDVAQRLLVSF